MCYVCVAIPSWGLLSITNHNVLSLCSYTILEVILSITNLTRSSPRGRVWRRESSAHLSRSVPVSHSCACHQIHSVSPTAGPCFTARHHIHSVSHTAGPCFTARHQIHSASHTAGPCFTARHQIHSASHTAGPCFTARHQIHSASHTAGPCFTTPHT